MNLELTDEQRLIQETAREFSDREIIPRARDNDRAERFDLELVKRIADMGYLGAPVAEEYGGRSLDYISYGLVVEEIGRGDSSARTVVSVQTSLVAGSIEQWGTEEQKRDTAPQALLGRVARLLRADRARHRLGRRLGGNAGDQAQRRLVHLRLEDVHLARQQREGRADLRADRSREEASWRRVLSRSHRPSRVHDAGDPRQAGAARVRYRGAGARRRRGGRRRDAGRDRRRLQDCDVRAGPRPLQRRGRLRRHLPGLRERVRQVREGAPPVQPPDRELPARAGADRGHGRRH